MGPFIRYWSMRYEGNHQKLKKTTSTTSGTVNLKMTIATKQSLKMCEMFNRLKCDEEVELGSRVANEHDLPILSLENYNSVKISGVHYKVGMFVVVSVNESEKEFGQITKIVKLEDQLYFDLNIHEELTFSKHYHAFIVERNATNTRRLKPNELPNYPSCFSMVTEVGRFIIVKYRL